MKILAYIHERTGDIRIVTQDRRSLIWHLPKQKYIDILKVPAAKNNIKDMLRLCVDREMHLKIPLDQKDKFHQTWVWSRGFWKKFGVLTKQKGVWI